MTPGQLSPAVTRTLSPRGIMVPGPWPEPLEEAGCFSRLSSHKWGSLDAYGMTTPLDGRRDGRWVGSEEPLTLVSQGLARRPVWLERHELVLRETGQALLWNNGKHGWLSSHTVLFRGRGATSTPLQLTRAGAQWCGG